MLVTFSSSSADIFQSSCSKSASFDPRIRGEWTLRSEIVVSPLSSPASLSQKLQPDHHERIRFMWHKHSKNRDPKMITSKRHHNNSPVSLSSLAARLTVFCVERSPSAHQQCLTYDSGEHPPASLRNISALYGHIFNEIELSLHAPQSRSKRIHAHRRHSVPSVSSTVQSPSFPAPVERRFRVF